MRRKRACKPKTPLVTAANRLMSGLPRCRVLANNRGIEAGACKPVVLPLVLDCGSNRSMQRLVEIVRQAGSFKATNLPDIHQRLARNDNL
jgi:hypothetical protein